MGISLIRLALLSIGLTLLALVLSFNLAEAISNFLSFAHNTAAYPGYAGFP
jgi:hypothetical protein